MQRFDFFFRQKVTEGELDAAFDAVEQMEFNLHLAQGLVGIQSQAIVTENSGTPNLTVDVSGPSEIRDQTGQRINWTPTQDIDVSVDESTNPTAVVTPGNERYLTIFAKFDRTLSDPRLDGTGAAVQFNRAEGFTINVVQGAEAVIPTATRPTLRADEIALCDVRLIQGQTQVLNADILTDRREDAFVVSAGSIAIQAGTVEAALQALATQIGVTGVDLADDTTPDDGVTLVGADAVAGAPTSLAQGTAKTQIGELLSAVNIRAVLTLIQTWTAEQNFDAPIDLGPGLVSSSADALLARLKMTGATNATSNNTLLAEFGAVALSGKTRIYVAAGGLGVDYLITQNARWTEPGNVWVKDVAAVATQLRFSFNSGLTIQRYQGVLIGDTWTPSYTGPASGGGGWDNRVRTLWGLDGIVALNQVAPRFQLDNGMLEFHDSAIGTDSDAHSNLARSSTPLKNTLYAKNIPKAWGVTFTDGAGGISLQDGFNYTASISGTQVAIAFNQVLANNAYNVVCSARGAAGAQVAESSSTAASGFALDVFDLVTSVAVARDLSSTIWRIDWAVFGEMT